MWIWREILSDEFTYDKDEDIDTKYFIGYKKDEKTRLLVVKLPQRRWYRHIKRKKP